MRPENGPSDQERSFIEQARRAQIVDAAVVVLARDGYASATLRQIAAQAGISKGLISYHFAGRTELMRHVLYGCYERIGREVMADLDLTKPPAEVLRILVHQTVQIGLAHAAERRAIDEILSNLREPDRRRTISFAEQDALLVGLEQLYRSGQTSGDFRRFDVRPMAVLHQAAVDATLLYLDSHPGTDHETFTGSMVDLLLHAITADPQPRR